MNTTDIKPRNTHSAERVLYQVQVRRREKTNPNVLLNGQMVDTEWQSLILPERSYKFTDHFDTAAELDDGLFPYALAMAEAWFVLSVEHAHVFDVRLVPHVVKTTYATFPQEPLPEVDRNPA